MARASTTDPEAHVMRNGDGGTVPSYNVQLLTDTTHGFVVNTEATTDAIDYRQADAALEALSGEAGGFCGATGSRWRLHQSRFLTGNSRSWCGLLRLVGGQLEADRTGRARSVAAVS